jgi:hypothetical protein
MLFHYLPFYVSLYTNFCSIVSLLFIILCIISCISYKASIIASGFNTLSDSPPLVWLLMFRTDQKSRKIIGLYDVMAACKFLVVVRIDMLI